MRDPARIPDILHRLQDAWLKSPDMRLGQLVCALTSYATQGQTVDPFYIEDHDMMRGLDVFMQDATPESPGE